MLKWKDLDVQRGRTVGSHLRGDRSMTGSAQGRGQLGDLTLPPGTTYKAEVSLRWTDRWVFPHEKTRGTATRWTSALKGLNDY